MIKWSKESGECLWDASCLYVLVFCSFLVIRLQVDGYLDYFYFLAIMNNVAMNSLMLLEHKSLCGHIFISLG